MSRVFVTGGSGFVGRRVLAELQRAGHAVNALDRSGRLTGEDAAGLTVVAGDLLSPETYREALRPCDTVIHLAAATGRASADEHARVNAQGTEVLLDECHRAGVERFLFVSSIATTFKDLRGYHYAQAKLSAEDIVRRSGLAFAIVRPAIILGAGAAVLGALEKLALLPIIMVPGSGRARVQPIHVDDVARAIVAVVANGWFRGDVFEIGGRDVVTMEGLIRRLRLARTGHGSRVMHVPLWLMRPPLRLVEFVGLGRVLPITAGQLSSFEWDGVVATNPLQDLIAPGTQPLDLMLDDSRLVPARATESAAALEAECGVFTRHVLGRDPDAYVTARYVDAHSRVPGLNPATPVDRTLVKTARLHPLAAKGADAFAAVFLRTSVLRKKLVLLLAILETRAPFYRTIDETYGRSPASAISRLAATGTIGVISLMIGTIVLLPVLVVASVLGKARS